MTIKDFSKLCGCNPQTLRYYDREGLLKPVKVDEWSGYRYYDEEQAIQALRDTLKKSMEEYSPVEEFGITDEECEVLKKNVDDYFGTMVKSEDRSSFDAMDLSDDKEDVAAFNKIINNPELVTVFERHDWENVKDFYNELPEIADGKEYSFLIRLSPEKKANTAFASALLGILCMKNQDKNMKVNCNVIASDDGKNHFWCRTN